MLIWVILLVWYIFLWRTQRHTSCSILPNMVGPLSGKVALKIKDKGNA